MVTTYYEIPLTSAPQRFNIALAGVQYSMLLVWRPGAMAGWFLDISTVGGTARVQGIPLVTGADLLEQYPDLNFGGSLRVTTDGDPDAVPTSANLGATARVYFGVAS